MVLISKQVLAKKYFPGLKKRQAVRKLRSWINFNKELSSELRLLDCKPKCRYFTPRQMQVIIHHLGAPNKMTEK